MATTPSPTSALLAQQLMQRLAGGGAPGQGGGGATAPDAAGSQIQQQFSSLQSADPELAGKTLDRIQQILTPLYMSMIQQVPDAASHIASAQKGLNQARKAIQQAAATLNTVRPQIANQAGMPPGFTGQAGVGGGGGMDVPGSGGGEF